MRTTEDEQVDELLTTPQPELPLVLSEESGIPAYLQIVRQVTYLVYSRRLEDEARLPTVRALAQQLGVHPNTVAQAYADLRDSGIIDTYRGRGTFVKPLGITRDSDWEHRRGLLQIEVERMRRRVHALGFTDEDIRAQVAGEIHSSEQRCVALFVAPAMGAQKYASLLTTHLEPNGVEVLPLEYEQLLERSEHADKALADTYFLLTPVSLKQQVEDLLEWHDTSHRVLGITLEITEAAAAQVAVLRADWRLCIYTSDRYVPIVLNILHSYGSVPLDRFERVLASSPPERVKAALDTADLIIHTYGVGPSLDELGVPDSKRLQLEFRPNSDSLDRLSDLFANRVGGRTRGDY